MIFGRVKDEVRPEIKRMVNALDDPRPILTDFGNRLVSAIVRRMPRGQEPEAGKPPVIRSGSSGLSGSLTFDLVGKRGLEVGTNKVYGRILHEGGVIKPRTARALAVPLNEAAARLSPREWGPGVLFFVPNPDPDTVGILFRKKGEDGVEPMYVLRGSVTIRPHPWLEVLDADWDYLEQRLSGRLA